jgi:hypothetical protein
MYKIGYNKDLTKELITYNNCKLNKATYPYYRIVYIWFIDYKTSRKLNKPVKDI